MPLTIPGTVGVVTPNLLSVALIGTDVPKFSLGVANGISQWAARVTISTTDAGSAGVGTGKLPLVVPQPLLLGAMFGGFSSFGLIGVFSPLMVLGLTNGIVAALLQGLISTTNPGVGVGVGKAKFKGPPAGASMALGFKSAGFVGDSTERMALAIGQALDTTFASLLIPVPIVGAGSPVSTTGVGTGKII